MSDIEFLVDDFKSEDRNKLNDIEKQIKEKPIRNYKEAVFLRRFIFSMMKQYYQPKHNRIMDLQRKINFSMPDLKMVIPHIFPKAPNKIEVNSFMPRAPMQLNLLNNAPEQKKEIRIEFPKLEPAPELPRRVIPVPRPIKVPRPV